MRIYLAKKFQLNTNMNIIWFLKAPNYSVFKYICSDFFNKFEYLIICSPLTAIAIFKPGAAFKTYGTQNNGI